MKKKLRKILFSKLGSCNVCRIMYETGEDMDWQGIHLSTRPQYGIFEPLISR